MSRPRKELRFAVDLTNFYYVAEPEQRLALRLVYQSAETAAINALWACTRVFSEDKYDIVDLFNALDTTAYELFYDEYLDEYELDTSDVELAILAIVHMAMDMYPVVMAYSRRLLDDGKSMDWVMESINDVEWHIPNNEDEQDDEREEMYIIAAVLEYDSFI